jgi:hypothetical protein
MALAVVSLEGCLLAHGEQLPSGVPSKMGELMYRTLIDSYWTIIIVSMWRNEELVTEWLLREGFHRYLKVITAEDALSDGDEFVMDTLQTVLAAGHHVNAYFDRNPNLIRFATQDLGLNSGVFHDAFTVPGRETESVYVPWTTRVRQADDDAVARSRMAQAAEAEGAFNG